MVFKLIRSVLGFESSESSSETDVTVEREPDDAAAAGTEASASTGSMTGEPPEEGAAEPAEAAGPTSETPDDAAAAGTEASASTGSMTEEPPEEGAAEPAEAAGAASTSDDADDADPDAETPDDAASDDDSGAAVPVEEVSGIGPAYAERLGEAGVESVADLLDADPEELADSTDISEKRIGRWQDRAEDA